MTKRMIVMLLAVAVFLGGIGTVKFRQIQAGMAMAASFQPPPEAVTTTVAAPGRLAGHAAARSAASPPCRA